MSRLPKLLMYIIVLSLVTVNFVTAQGTEKPRKCIMVFGAHADDVEPMAGGTFAK